MGLLNGNLPCWPLVRNAHVAAVQWALGHQLAIAGFLGCPGQFECQLRRKLTLSCAVHQIEVDPLLPIRRCPDYSGSVTGTVIPGWAIPLSRFLALPGRQTGDSDQLRSFAACCQDKSCPAKYSAAITTAASMHGNQISQKSSPNSRILDRFQQSVPEVLASTILHTFQVCLRCSSNSFLVAAGIVPVLAPNRRPIARYGVSVGYHRHQLGRGIAPLADPVG